METPRPFYIFHDSLQRETRATQHRDIDEKMDDETLVFWVNGKEVRELRPSPTESLISFLRRRLGLTGTKLGCAEG